MKQTHSFKEQFDVYTNCRMQLLVIKSVIFNHELAFFKGHKNSMKNVTHCNTWTHVQFNTDLISNFGYT